MTEYQTRPIEQWPCAFTKNRKRSPFRSGWGDTMQLLKSELGHLKASAIVLLMALRPQEIRNDGRPRADAKPAHPGVILSFTTPKGPMQFPCDKFNHWADNVRAIALALEALRKVDRYGITKSGEQYKGWQALPAPGESSVISNRVDALAFIAKVTSIFLPVDSQPDVVSYAVREAEKKTHPDRGGDSDEFKKVQQARKVLLA